jgi:hypothetical protein
LRAAQLSALLLPMYMGWTEMDAGYEPYYADDAPPPRSGDGLDWDNAPWVSIVGFSVTTVLGVAILAAKVCTRRQQRRKKMAEAKRN